MDVKISLLFLSFCFATAISKSILDPIDQQWKDFKKKFEKKYSDADESTRYKIFKKNVGIINDHNENDFTYKLGINQFADLDENEISELLSTENVRIDIVRKPSEYQPKYDIQVPGFLDWRKNYSFEVKNEEDCKSDWAFAATGMLEGYLFRKFNQFTPLSAQDLIECSEFDGNNGCDGGYVEYALKYVKKHGIATEKLYPFVNEDKHPCKSNIVRDVIPDYSNIACQQVISGDEGDMKHTLFTKGPIAAKIFAPWKFFFYEKGIFTGEECKPNEVNFNVLVVGYSNTTKEPGNGFYWIVQNWFGKGWGEDGYARIALNGGNTCGISSKAWQIN